MSSDGRVFQMLEKNNTQVLIGGKVFTLSGYESEDYLQRIAIYLNNKIVDMNKVDGYKHLNIDMQNMLLQINVADDFYKAKDQVIILEENIAGKDKEIYDLKHELISAQIKLEEFEKSRAELIEKNHELQKKVIKIETELEDYHKGNKYEE